MASRHPNRWLSETLDCKQEADDWAKEIERRITLGEFTFTAHNKHHTYADLLLISVQIW